MMAVVIATSGQPSGILLPVKVMDEPCLKDNDPTMYGNIQEYLAREVKQYPCLYNVFCKDYKNVRLKERCWREIGGRLGMDAEVCRAKWRNVRDRYVKEMRKERSGCSSTTAKPWPMIPKLRFLDISINRRRSLMEESETLWDPSMLITPGSSEQQTPRFASQSLTVAVPSTYAATVVYSASVGETACAIVQDSQCKLEAESSGQNNSRLPSTDTHDEEASTSVSPDQVPTTSQDADISFLLSMLPQLRRIPDRRKNLLKIEMLQMIHKVAEEVDGPDAAHSSHTGFISLQNVFLSVSKSTGSINYAEILLPYHQSKFIE